MRNIHGFILRRSVEKRITRLLRAFACVQKRRAEKKARRENILSVNGHLRRDAGLDDIPHHP